MDVADLSEVSFGREKKEIGNEEEANETPH